MVAHTSKTATNQCTGYVFSRYLEIHKEDARPTLVFTLFATHARAEVHQVLFLVSSPGELLTINPNLVLIKPKAKPDKQSKGPRHT